MIWQRSLFKKKLIRHGVDFIRPVLRLYYEKSNKDNLPPIIVNSFPKSGTHLLLQVVGSLPGTRDFGQFFASTPSFRYKEVNSKIMASRIRKLLPGEISCGHIYYSDDVKEAIESVGAIHYFIYRDLRDVCISEAYYLRDMNKWHYLHKYYAGLEDYKECIDLAIRGFGCDKADRYPDIIERFNKYRGWVNDESTFSVKFEDLLGQSMPSAVASVVHYYASSARVDSSSLVDSAMGAINPAKSHTFRKGSIGNWKLELTRDQKIFFHNKAEMVIRELGYEETL